MTIVGICNIMHIDIAIMTIVGIMPVNVCRGTGPSLIVNTPWRQKQSVAYCEHPKVRAHTFGESVAYSIFSSTIATTTYHYQVRR